tara:strand:- start:156 stop:983 length:828 start_codon:yes stop_codon:yes gene_type:complete
MDDREFEKYCLHYWEVQEHLLRESYAPTDPVRDRAWLTNSHIPQSQLCLILMLPIIMKYIGKCGRKLKIADIGCGMGAGTQLLASLTKSRFFGGREIQVYGFDNLGIYERYNRAFNKDVIFSAKRLEDIPQKETFDITLSSNMFEHFEDPLPLIEQMKRLTKRFSIILVPYNEPPHIEPDHLTSFTDDLIQILAPCEVRHSATIGTDPSDQVCFVLDCRKRELDEVVQEGVRGIMHYITGQRMYIRLSRHFLGRVLIAIGRFSKLTKFLRRHGQN